MAKPTDGTQLIGRNRKARHDYIILETYEAGIQLRGTEVKSLREGRVSLAESFVRPQEGELVLFGAHIDAYSAAGYAHHDPVRPRKLLMHRREIRRIAARVAEKGLTLVPLSVYFKRGHAKVEIGLARGKRRYDKRQALKKRDAARAMRRALSSRRG